MHRVFERFALSVQDHATGNGPHEYVRTLPVYVTTAYEGEPTRDNDPNQEAALLGVAEGTGNVSYIYLETLRDYAQEIGSTAADLYARTTAHEIGHQFALATAEADKHRGGSGGQPADNIMAAGGTGNVPADKFYFHPIDIAFLRKRIHSPGLIS